MEATTWPASRQYEDRAVTWDKKFEQRRTEAYGGENVKLTPVHPQTKLTVFYDRQAIQLDPQEYAFSALRGYLKSAKESLLSVDTRAPEDTSLALLNDRRDPEQGELSARNWQRYQTHPPSGVKEDIVVLDARGLYWILSQNVRLSRPLAQDGLLTVLREVTGQLSEESCVVSNHHVANTC